MTNQVSKAPGASGGTDILGHPRGLIVCFFMEMWERFSYYGMRALLIFYLTQHFLFGQKSFLIYGAYTSLVYLVPVIGGMLADRYLGSRKAVTLGALLLVAGHFGMAFEGPPAQEFIEYQGVQYELVTEGRSDSAIEYLRFESVLYNIEKGVVGITVRGLEDGSSVPSFLPHEEYTTTIERDDFYLNIFYLSLALIITGVGFLKANISTIVGALYKKNDARRDGGFTIFYMGINLGAFLAPLLCGYLGEVYGWKYGFGLAGFGMLAGLFVFLRGQPWLEGKADPPDAKKLKERIFLMFSREHVIWLGSIVGVLAIWWLVQHQVLVGYMLGGFGALMLAVVLFYSFTKCEKPDRDRMMVASTLIVFSVLFWSLFEQAGSSLNLLADTNVDRTIFGFTIPASMFQSLNPMFIILLAPLFSIMWVWLDKKGWEPATPFKFSIGIFLVGFGFLVMWFGAQFADSVGQFGLIWLVLIYFIHTTGELCLSPVGLSMVTKLSVAKVVGMMMGVWFMASAGANYIAGLIARETGGETLSGRVVDPAANLDTVMGVYLNVGLLAIGVALLLFILSPLLKKGMHGVH